MGSKVVNVVGVHQRLQGYPNVLYLLEELEDSGKLDYVSYNVPMWSGNFSSKTSVFGKTRNVVKALCSHIKIIHYFIKNPELDCVYVPYPAVFIAFALFILPKKIKPRFLVIDAFISIYDTVIEDRKLYSKSGLLARLLRKIEKEAFDQADVVITDTHQNSIYYSELFELPLNLFIDVPLATDEKCFNSNIIKRVESDEKFNVVFIGTLIPLHGIETIMRSTKLLAGNTDIQFTIIGDGQMSPLVERVVEDGTSNLRWIRQWQSSKSLIDHIRQADIGLGIFGEGGKTQRVCPYKLYMYFACGLPVVTGRTEWSMGTKQGLDYAPFIAVPVGNPEELASSILKCRHSKSLCEELGRHGRKFYNEKLANKIAREKIEGIFTCQTA